MVSHGMCILLKCYLVLTNHNGCKVGVRSCPGMWSYATFPYDLDVTLEHSFETKYYAVWSITMYGHKVCGLAPPSTRL